jgi:hypothetical protein
MVEYMEDMHGCTPFAWWKFEQHANQPNPPEYEAKVLDEMGLLSQEHRRYWAASERIRKGKPPLSVAK